MATQTRSAVVEAGRKLKLLRETQEWTQRDIAFKSRGVLTNQQISRIEDGQIDKPPMKDLVLYGGILGLTPNQVAALYDYWAGEDTASIEDAPQVLTIRRLLRTLPDDLRRMLLHHLNADIADIHVRMAPPAEEPF
jgi:transcriptional regulator with XRE-family HTH domain